MIQQTETKPKGGDKEGKGSSSSKEGGGDSLTDAILITGATHARELLSSQIPLYIGLKMLH